MSFYPYLTRKQVEDVIKRGLMQYYMTNAYGGDVLLRTSDYVMITGKLFKNSLL